MKRNAFFIGVKSNRLGGRFIRWWTGQKLDHIALINLDTNLVYEISYLGKIRFHSFASYEKNAEILICDEVPLDFQLCARWMRRHKDDPYDWIRTLGWPLRRWWQADNPKAINCIEFGEGIAREHGFTVTDGYNIEAWDFYSRLLTRGSEKKIKTRSTN